MPAREAAPPLRCAVTGATGFIGSALTRRLLGAGHHVVGLGRNSDKLRHMSSELGMHPLCGDICDDKTLRTLATDCDIVFHCAAQLGVAAADAFSRVNVIAPERLTRICAASKVRRLVHLSSIEVYGNFNGRLLDENTNLELCGNLYADSKQLGERAILTASKQTPLEVALLRIAMVYGPASPFWTTRLAELTKQGKWILLDRGTGSCYPIFVEDVLDAIVKAAAVPMRGAEIFNITPSQHVSWKEWATKWCEICGVDAESIRFRSSKRERLLARLETCCGLPPRSLRHIEVMTRAGRFSNQKAHQILGWEPKVSLEEGMLRSRQWLEQTGLLPRNSKLRSLVERDNSKS